MCTHVKYRSLHLLTKPKRSKKIFNLNSLSSISNDPDHSIQIRRLALSFVKSAAKAYSRLMMTSKVNGRCSWQKRMNLTSENLQLRAPRQWKMSVDFSVTRIPFLYYKLSRVRPNIITSPWRLDKTYILPAYLHLTFFGPVCSTANWHVCETPRKWRSSGPSKNSLHNPRSNLINQPIQYCYNSSNAPRALKNIASRWMTCRK